MFDNAVYCFYWQLSEVRYICPTRLKYTQQHTHTVNPSYIEHFITLLHKSTECGIGSRGLTLVNILSINVAINYRFGKTRTIKGMFRSAQYWHVVVYTNVKAKYT